MTESYEDDFEIDSNMDAEDLKAVEEEKKQQKWGWEQLIWHLCNEDLTKFHAVCDLPLILVFNFLGMRKELNV
jgi:protease II